MPIFAEPPDSYTRTHIVWDGGWLELDCSEREFLDHDSDVTDHPVDEGADVTDHQRLHTIPVTLDAWITDSPLALPQTHTDGSLEIQDITVVEIESPIFPGAPTSVGPFKLGHKKAVNLRTLNYQPQLNRVQSVYEELEAIQRERRLLTVVLSRFRTFDSMLLKRFTVDRTVQTAGSLQLVLEFRQVNLVTTRAATVKIPVREPKTERSRKSSDAGKKQTKAVDTAENQSLAARAADAVAGWF